MSLTQCEISRLTAPRATRRAVRVAAIISRRDTAIAEQFRPSHPFRCHRCATTPPSSAGVRAGMWWKSGRDWRRAEEPHYLGRREATDEFRDVGVSIPLVPVLVSRGGTTSKMNTIFFHFCRSFVIFFFRHFFFFLLTRHPGGSDRRRLSSMWRVLASLIFTFLPDRSVNNNDSSRESFDSRLAILISWDRESDRLEGCGRTSGELAKSSPAMIEIGCRKRGRFCRIFVIGVDIPRLVAVKMAGGLSVNSMKD